MSKTWNSVFSLFSLFAVGGGVLGAQPQLGAALGGASIGGGLFGGQQNKLGATGTAGLFGAMPQNKLGGGLGGGGLFGGQQQTSQAGAVVGGGGLFGGGATGVGLFNQSAGTGTQLGGLGMQNQVRDSIPVALIF